MKVLGAGRDCTVSCAEVDLEILFKPHGLQAAWVMGSLSKLFVAIPGLLRS